MSCVLGIFCPLKEFFLAHPEGSHLLPWKLNHCCHCLNICYPSSDHSKVLCQSCWKLNFSRRRACCLTLNSVLNLKPSIKLHLADGCIMDSFIYFWTSKSLILVGQMTNVAAFLKLRIGNNYLQLFLLDEIFCTHLLNAEAACAFADKALLLR